MAAAIMAGLGVGSGIETACLYIISTAREAQMLIHKYRCIEMGNVY